MRGDLRRGVLLEREGVILHRPAAGDDSSSGDLEFLPRALEALRLFAQHNIAVRVFSHQPVIGTGQVASRVLEKQARRFLLETALEGGHIEKV